MEIKKILGYCSLFVLTGCLTSGGGTSFRTPQNTESKKTDKSDKKDNPRKNSDDSKTKSTLQALSNIESVKSTISAENTSRIKNAFNSYNKGVSATSDKVTASSDNFAKAEEYLKATQQEINPINIGSMISAIEALQKDYDDYKPVKENYDSLNHVLKTSADFTDADPKVAMNKYANYLQQNVDKSIASVNRGVDDAQYITAVEQKYYEYIQKNTTGIVSASVSYTAYSSETGSSAAYKDMMTTLATQLASVETSVKTKGDAVVADLKALDSNVTEMPLTIESVVTFWNTQKKILSAVKDVKYLPDISEKKDDMKVVVFDENMITTTVNVVTPPASEGETTPTTSEGSTSEGETPTTITTTSTAVTPSTTFGLSYSYNSAFEDYTLDGKRGETTVSFKADDFVKDTITKTYIAKKNADDVTVTEAITFLPNLWTWLNSGGKTDAEFRARKNEAQLIFEAVRKGSATTDEKLKFENWVKNPDSETPFISIENLANTSSDDYKNWDIANTILKSAKDANFTLTQHIKKTDTAYLGGNYTGLTFSDYGMWQTTTDISYTGNNTLLSFLASTSAKSSTKVQNNSFYSGLESFKQAYTADQTKGNVSFIGNTIGYADLVATNGEKTGKQLTGTAKLTIKQADVTGELNLGFENWYGFTVEGIDLSKPDFNSLNPAKISTSCNSCGWLKNPTFTTAVAGSQYGLEANTPVEAVGTYLIESNDVIDPDKYTKVSISGAFGVKK